jgi:NAD(P)-dependent dehydrogenase (short-subunit alcohol dehydrogenase family)
MMNKNIVVIGASRGIGSELVLQLAEKISHTVYAFSRDLKAMEKRFAQCHNVFSYPLDLQAKDLKSSFSSQIATIGSIDILIYNAGYLVNKPFLQLTQTDIHSSYQVNVMSAFEIIQAAMPYFVHKAHVVSISSMGGVQGTIKFSGLSSYSTSKAALVSLTELLSEEFKDTQWSFNCLALGAAQTEMLEAAFPGYRAPVSASEMASYIAEFSLTAHKFIRGKIIPVSLSTP